MSERIILECLPITDQAAQQASSMCPANHYIAHSTLTIFTDVAPSLELFTNYTMPIFTTIIATFLVAYSLGSLLGFLKNNG